MNTSAEDTDGGWIARRGVIYNLISAGGAAALRDDRYIRIINPYNLNRLIPAEGSIPMLRHISRSISGTV